MSAEEDPDCPHDLTTVAGLRRCLWHTAKANKAVAPEHVVTLLLYTAASERILARWYLIEPLIAEAQAELRRLGRAELADRIGACLSGMGGQP